MRILMISDVYFPRVNGVSTSIRTFRRELVSLGHQVTLIAPDYGEPTDDEAWIIRVPAKRVLFDPEDRMMGYRAAKGLLDRLRKGDYEILHIQTPFIAHYAGAWLARELGIPTVLTYHTYFEEYLHHYLPLVPKGVIQPLVRWFSRSQCGDVDAVVVPSTVFRTVLQDYGVRSELHVRPTGIDLRRFTGGDGSRFRAARGIDPQRPVVMFVGRIVHEKNIGFLLEVVNEVRRTLPDILFVMAGEGPAEGALKERAIRLGLDRNVRFVGNLHSLPELVDCYSAADLFLFASRTETQGLVLLEAMALGVPVVSTAEMGTRDILGAGRGAAVVEEDLHAFAAKVTELLNDPQGRHRLGAEGIEYAREWSAGEMARRMVELYEETIEMSETLDELEESIDEVTER
ncbi:glycosyltransferase [Endothiovibrio diazotrophicus]